jgi:Protein of unknown function, DUF488
MRSIYRQRLSGPTDWAWTRDAEDIYWLGRIEAPYFYDGGAAAAAVDPQTVDDLIAVLRSAMVKVLVDVRLTPLSRKAGLSKNGLGARLREAGIERRRTVRRPTKNAGRPSGACQLLQLSTCESQRRHTRRQLGQRRQP